MEHTHVCVCVCSQVSPVLPQRRLASPPLFVLLGGSKGGYTLAGEWLPWLGVIDQAHDWSPDLDDYWAIHQAWITVSMELPATGPVWRWMTGGGGWSSEEARRQTASKSAQIIVLMWGHILLMKLFYCLINYNYHSCNQVTVAGCRSAFILCLYFLL